MSDSRACPVCSRMMIEDHRYGPLLMNRPRELLYYKWLCSQDYDGQFLRHYVEIQGKSPATNEGPTHER
jgi:hypothetical protein